jgi:type IV pilus assembly protein PilB
VAIHEIMTVDPTIRSMISRNAPTDDIYKYVRENNRVKFLSESLVKMVVDKKTSMEELLKLTYFVE